ncbi:BON domain-containing protein [Neorhodopirellula pilleata]|uniref:BON domain protein n=1 Tax=Neorhodopirellula pilleata TaxID=2714738 RepID=A0A5C6AVQ3_9BACT|nr:BON domain-containing protein [Neorhodopirellula pilleata]TWU03678.1 BON domain protein [Neorhodopirellula pilleata]
MSSLTSSPHSLSHDQTDLGHCETILLRQPQNELSEQLLRVDSAIHSVETMKQESALAVLATNSVAELRFLRVDENDDEIHLSGHVRSFYHKQLAQEAVRPIAEGRRVINRVTVAG